MQFIKVYLSSNTRVTQFPQHIFFSLKKLLTFKAIPRICNDYDGKMRQQKPPTVYLGITALCWIELEVSSWMYTIFRTS